MKTIIIYIKNTATGVAITALFTLLLATMTLAQQATVVFMSQPKAVAKVIETAAKNALIAVASE